MPMISATAVPTAKLRSRKVAGSNSGARDVAVWMANMVKNSAARPTSMLVSGESNQSLRWPRSNSSWAAAMAMAMKTKPV